jgi:hypothetical protein
MYKRESRNELERVACKYWCFVQCHTFFKLVVKMRPKGRWLAQHGDLPCWLEESDPAGCDFVHDGRSMPAGMTRETERGGPCRPIETEVNRDSGSTYGRVSFLGYVPPYCILIWKYSTLKGISMRY